MSEQELYKIAEQRVNRRTRRWMFWSLDLLGLIFSLVALVAFGDSSASDLLAAIFVGWMGVFAFHSILTWMADNREGDIEKEVARLRAAMDYEKPKRLEISDDGELAEMDEPVKVKADRS